MHLLGIETKQLYGSLNVNLKFKRQLNLLVGINGSGKTSILNAIEWLLRADLVKLAINPFELIRLRLEHQGKRYTLVARQTAKRALLSLEGGSRRLNPITVEFERHPSLIRTAAESQLLLESYAGLGYERKEMGMVGLLESLPRPVTISLDRTIAAEAGDRIYREPTGEPELERRRRNTPPQSPLKRVQEVVAKQYQQYRSALLQLNEDLKARIVVSTFKDPLQEPQRRRVRILSTAEIVALQKRVMALFSTTIRESGNTGDVKNFFLKAREGQRAGAVDLDYALFRQLNQISSLAEAFDEFERKSALAYEHIKKYLDTANRFFHDSNKEIVITDDGRLGFSFLEGRKSKAVYAPEQLSSGERQILILLTFLAFVAEEDRMFIVDEPELSLHPKWQSDFLGAFLDLAPKGTQLLIATHSPEIVAHHKSACVVLRP